MIIETESETVNQFFSLTDVKMTNEDQNNEEFYENFKKERNYLSIK